MKTSAWILGFSLILIALHGSPHVLANEGANAESCIDSIGSDFNSYDANVLCANSATALPVDCYAKTPEPLSAPLSALLCSGSQSLAPVSCYERSAELFTDDPALSAILCSKARDNSPIDCAEAAPKDLELPNVALLCSGAKSKAPVDCYNSTPDSLGMYLSSLLCSGAKTTKPLKCFQEHVEELGAEKTAQFCSENKLLAKSQFPEVFVRNLNNRNRARAILMHAFNRTGKQTYRTLNQHLGEVSIHTDGNYSGCYRIPGILAFVPMSNRELFLCEAFYKQSSEWVRAQVMIHESFHSGFGNFDECEARKFDKAVMRDAGLKNSVQSGYDTSCR